jgi:hypothetical protein
LLIQVLPILIPRNVEGENKGKLVFFEIKKMLDTLFSIDLERIQQECNRVAIIYRDKWSTKNPNKLMIEEGLEHTSYGNGIIELDPPFLLNTPVSINIYVLNSRVDRIDSTKSPDACAAVNVQDPQNPLLYVFLPTLEVINSTIIWTHRPMTSFKSVMIHEFLHLCGEVETPTRKIVDGVIRHTKIGTEAIDPLITHQMDALS